MQQPKRKQTNGEFAKGDAKFNAACSEVELKPTTRQASKFRMGLGKAYKQGRK